MPRLYLLRHAKAERSGKHGPKDFDRALSERGVADARRMGELLAERGDKFDLVLCSASVRTRQTWDGLRDALKSPPEPRYLREIYDEDASYVPILQAEGGEADAVLLIGHNPAIHATAVELAADLGGKDGAALKEYFPTAAVAIFDFDGEWTALAPGSANLSAFVPPREGAHD